MGTSTDHATQPAAGGRAPSRPEARGLEVVQVTYSVDPRWGGPAQTVPGLCKALDGCGARTTLHAIAPAPEALSRRIRVVAHPQESFPYPRLGLSPSMRRALLEAAATADILHANGCWQMPCIYPSWAARKTGCRLVASPRGAFSTHALRWSRWRKRVMWWGFQRRALRQAACLHATAEAEFQDIRRAGLRAPVTIIPNGVPMPDRPSAGSPEGQPRRLLYLSRVHPQKGTDMLVRAWRRLQDSVPDWVLDVVGHEDKAGYMEELRALAGSIGAERVTFHGPAYGEQKDEAFRRADLFVLPTHFENFGLAAAEALAFGVPAIVTRRAPWEGLERNECGWWIELGEDPLVDALRDALARPREDLRAMGERGREWMRRDCSWERVGQMMYETYLWVLGGGAAPPWVRERD